MIILFVLALLVIIFTWKNPRQKKREAEKSAEVRKIQKEKEEYYYLKRNVICEDGITRVYRNDMFGIIKEETIVLYGHPLPPSLAFLNPEEYRTRMESTNQLLNRAKGFYEVTGKILSEIALHFKIQSIKILINEEWHDEIDVVNFSKAKWFSANGTVLSKGEIIDFDAEYYVQKKKWVRSDTSLPKIQIITIHEINGYYFISGPLSERLGLFNGYINDLKVNDGIAIEELVETENTNPIYKLIFEERTIYNSEHEELDNCEVIGFLDLHVEEDGFTQLCKELSDIVPNSLVVQTSSNDEGYMLVTNVPEHYIDNSTANGNFEEVNEYSEAEQAISFIRNLKKVAFGEIELWED